MLISAQDLLKQWADDKLKFSGSFLDEEYSDPKPASCAAKTRSEIRHEFETLVDTDGFGLENNFTPRNDHVQKKKGEMRCVIIQV